MKVFAGLLALLTVAMAGVAQPVKKHILYFTHSASYFHEILPYSTNAMKKWAEKDGTYTVDQTDDCSVITPERLSQYDGLVFYTNRELPIAEPNRQAILEFVRQGKGFVAIHSGTGTFFEWPPYQEMINGDRKSVV
jgi:type 1 glutamine amidotransferase